MKTFVFVCVNCFLKSFLEFERHSFTAKLGHGEGLYKIFYSLLASHSSQRKNEVIRVLYSVCGMLQWVFGRIAVSE